MQVSSKTVGGRGGEGWLGRVGVEWVGGRGLFLQTAVRYFLTESEIFVPLFFITSFCSRLKTTHRHTQDTVFNQ